jgi:hypothetical protein
MKMKVNGHVWAVAVVIASSLIASCAVNREQIKWHYIQGIMEEPGKDPVPVISVEKWNTREVVFNVEGDFAGEYFFILDGDELVSKPVYWTGAAYRRVFQIKIAAKAGSVLEEGKEYRLAAAKENPETGGNRRIANDQFLCLYIGNFTLTNDKRILDPR